MTYRGTYKNGMVVVENPAGLADGDEVSLRPIRSRSKAKKPRITMREELAWFIGRRKGLPRDVSSNIDHYLYGPPKRK